MLVSTSCCLNLSPPTLPSSSTSKPTHQVSWLRNNEKRRRQCLFGAAAACVVIGLQLGNNSEDIMSSTAVAQEMPVTVMESDNKAVSRWSDKRMCPPWRLNSLETIVPENLPRPSARRRWESVRDSDNIIPPAVKVVVKIRNGSNCFSM